MITEALSSDVKIELQYLKKKKKKDNMNEMIWIEMTNAKRRIVDCCE